MMVFGFCCIVLRCLVNSVVIYIFLYLVVALLLIELWVLIC